MTFIYSTCEDTCPGQVQPIRGALDRLGHDLPVLRSPSTRANDTPARAQRFLLEQHVTGRMRFVLGSERELAPVWKGYGIAPQRGTLDHSAYVVLVDGEGLQRIGFPHSSADPRGPRARPARGSARRAALATRVLRGVLAVGAARYGEVGLAAATEPPGAPGGLAAPRARRSRRRTSAFQAGPRETSRRRISSRVSGTWSSRTLSSRGAHLISHSHEAASGGCLIRA